MRDLTLVVGMLVVEIPALLVLGDRLGWLWDWVLSL
jgi:hypothetical protein